MKRFPLLILAALLVLAVLPAAAQEDYFAPFADIPQSRTEDGAFVLGDPDAPVTIVEFADFMCPHCQAYQTTVNRFIEQYVATGQAKFEYRFYPIVHPQYSVFTAQIAECAEVQRDGAFWAAHDMLYDLASNGKIGPNTPEAIAEMAGIDAEKLEACLATATQHETDSALARSIGANGTPAVTVRLPDDTLGWAFVRGAIRNSGGLPIEFLTDIVTAPEVAAMVVQPIPLLADLVTESDCTTACWRSIIPGETAFEDVADIIRADRQNVEINVGPLQEGGLNAVSWRQFDSALADPNFIMEGEDGTVELISLLDISIYGLGDVIEVQGEPQYALAVASSQDTALFYAIYEEKALVVLAFLTAETGLSEFSAVVGAQYFTPAAMSELLAETGVVAWTGYDGLNTYFR